MCFQSRSLRCIAALLALVPGRAADCCKNSAAVVQSLTGQAAVRLPGTSARAAISNLDWIADGATVEVGPKSSVTLILLNGHRYELGAGASATIGTAALSSAKGSVHELQPLPPIPSPAPIAENTAATSGAVRFRGSKEIHNLYPRDGMATMAESTKLTFARVPDASVYKVELKDDDGEDLINSQTTSNELSVPTGALQYGARYSWHVRAIGPGGIIAEGAATFITISKKDLEQRKEFAVALRASADDPLAVALMADLDFRLGLLHEALQGFQTALRVKPGDASIQRALDLVQAALAEKPE